MEAVAVVGEIHGFVNSAVAVELYGARRLFSDLMIATKLRSVIGPSTWNGLPVFEDPFTALQVQTDCKRNMLTWVLPVSKNKASRSPRTDMTRSSSK